MGSCLSRKSNPERLGVGSTRVDGGSKRPSKVRETLKEVVHLTRTTSLKKVSEVAREPYVIFCRDS
jgi:hypothetical protein